MSKNSIEERHLVNNIGKCYTDRRCSSNINYYKHRNLPHYDLHRSSIAEKDIAENTTQSSQCPFLLRCSDEGRKSPKCIWQWYKELRR